MGTTTLGGSQHTAGIRLLRKAGLNPDKDLKVVSGGDVPTQLQALVNGSIQVGILSPPMVIVARDKYKMNILGSAIDEFTSIQNGLGFLEGATCSGKADCSLPGEGESLLSSE